MRTRTLQRAALLAAALALTMPGTAGADTGASGVPVKVTTLKRGSLPKVLIAYGSVEAGSAARETVMAPASARVSQVYVRPGEEVAQDAPLVRLVPSPATAASFSQAQTAVHVARALVERTKKMVGQHLATQQQLADAEKSEADAKSNLSALEAQGAGGPSTLRAPFHAIVTVLSTSTGAIVAEGSALLELVRPEGLVLTVGVVPSQAGAIMDDDPVKIRALGAKTSMSGKVLMRASLVDPGTGLIGIEISLPPGSLLPGERAEAKITTGRVQGFVVPHEAILVNDQGEPYVVQAVNMHARTIPVEVLDARGDEDVIRGKLEANAPLVLAGNYQLEDGMKLEIGPSDQKAMQ